MRRSVPERGGWMAVALAASVVTLLLLGFWVPARGSDRSGDDIPLPTPSLSPLPDLFPSPSDEPSPSPSEPPPSPEPSPTSSEPPPSPSTAPTPTGTSSPPPGTGPAPSDPAPTSGGSADGSPTQTGSREGGTLTAETLERQEAERRRAGGDDTSAATTPPSMSTWWFLGSTETPEVAFAPSRRPSSAGVAILPLIVVGALAVTVLPLVFWKAYREWDR